MPHKFDIGNKRGLDDEVRVRLLSPHETLKKAGFKKGGTMADIGCGTGLFTIAAAKTGGADTKIFAVDVSEEMLDVVSKRAIDAGFNNIETVKSDEYDFKLKSGSADLVLICAVLHEIDDKKRFLMEAARICKPEGKITVVEFNETNTVLGPRPPLGDRLERAHVCSLLADAGFNDAVAEDISEAIYIVMATKPR
jgi:ubiquinone/menaquinone biosynthesis C-methylase UbiE